MTRTALYTGTFDPVTNGHLDVVRNACRLVDRLVIAIGVHSSKAPIFTADEPHFSTDHVDEIARPQMVFPNQ